MFRNECSLLARISVEGLVYFFRLGTCVAVACVN